MLMKNTISACTRGIRMRAAGHQQDQVIHLATKILFRPQQMHKAQDFSFRSLVFSSAWVLVFPLVWWIVSATHPHEATGWGG